ncbi:FAD/NAD(P)-binding domain-containing protein [Lophium mytilinum]|uniref:FAD/NAD(P)-binding domain-containing protein n=1 Tax=Lophium mytilinum TaxID=390894 RepID=A0A6A6R7T9_9PEZI|nr:FAD/NAD(P)-binding domain-containing protein [Lophium mytilinum]
MSGLKVLVVGASIAGPATAYWLAKAGAQVTVIERFPELRTSGQAVDIRTAGVSVMRKMSGMEAQVRAKSTQEEGISFVREDGRPYGTIRATGNPDQQSLVSEYEIFRGDLAKIIFDLTKDDDNITYIFNEQIASMQQSESDGSPITVEFANGSATSKYDLVIGCDGATSRTRAIGFGCSVRDHIIPSNSWAAYFTINQDLLQGSRVGQGYSAVGGRFMSVGLDPSGHSRVLLMNIHSRGKLDATLPFRQASIHGDDSLKRYIAQHYQGAGWKSNYFMQEMMDSEDFYASEIVQVKLPSLYNGRFVLVGDAGYATGPAGGGTSLALAGAYILAGEVGKHTGDLAAGLKGYEQQMRPIIKEMQKIPPFITTILAPQTTWGIWLRNYAFAFIAWTGIADFAQKYLGAAFANTKTFPLPDYKWVA